ncbi:GxxExxY protein [Opitutaceae bacterium TAV4]|uniref:GxxExxY protein n=1 Tax=Geminisphaera colitermitum TaxID=1148786 RepID=UPI000158D1A2|nr:GxxExxY protein [Geminisphaera colitermitum]RRJ98042.1 GxxExxY protein [Opitutaceae bacterium TAV4]RRK02629.1 GxxExxY protein [Opitutaceae bacterium TAV3]
MKNELLFKNEVYAIVGAALEVHNVLGYGLHEKAYENALVHEFVLRRIPFEQQPRFPVIYKEVTVAEFIPDLIAFRQVIVDTKVIDQITDYERGQILNYLHITGLQVGLLLNFKHQRLQWERLVLSSRTISKPTTNERE